MAESGWTMIDDMDVRERKTIDEIRDKAEDCLMKELFLVDRAILKEISEFIKKQVDLSERTIREYVTDVRKSKRGSRCENYKARHEPEIKLFMNLLMEFKFPEPTEPNVVLCLKLLRLFGHLDRNQFVLAKLRVAQTVLGIMQMSSCIDVIRIVKYSLDIAAKVAKYKFRIGEKIPLHDGYIDIVIRALEHHNKDITIYRSACHLIANLVSTLLELSLHWMATENAFNQTARSAVDQCIDLAFYATEKLSPLITSQGCAFTEDKLLQKDITRLMESQQNIPHVRRKNEIWKQRSAVIGDQRIYDRLSGGHDASKYTSFRDLTCQNFREASTPCCINCGQMPTRPTTRSLPNQRRSTDSDISLPEGFLSSEEDYEDSGNDSSSSEDEGLTAHDLDDEFRWIAIQHIMKHTVGRKKTSHKPKGRSFIFH